jgi:hypothetical protein
MDAKHGPNDICDGDAIQELEDATIAGCKEVAVKGNYCDSNSPFSHDLVPGEQIHREFAVVLKSPSLTWQQKILILLTFGLYFLYLRYCTCCRGLQLFGGRHKLAVTTFGRVLLWKSEIHGEQTGNVCFCIPGFKTLTSHTRIASFSIRKLSMSNVVMFMIVDASDVAPPETILPSVSSSTTTLIKVPSTLWLW